MPDSQIHDILGIVVKLSQGFLFPLVECLFILLFGLLLFLDDSYYFMVFKDGLERSDAR
jgi:hypothetical protein